MSSLGCQALFLCHAHMKTGRKEDDRAPVKAALRELAAGCCRCLSRQSHQGQPSPRNGNRVRVGLCRRLEEQPWAGVVWTVGWDGRPRDAPGRQGGVWRGAALAFLPHTGPKRHTAGSELHLLMRKRWLSWLWGSRPHLGLLPRLSSSQDSDASLPTSKTR